MSPISRDSTPSRPVRRGRPPKGAEQLSRAAIVDAAIAVIDVDGVASVTMRAVGRKLGVDAKSLYNHVDGKDALLDAVAERILDEMRVPELTGSAATDLRAIAQAFRDSALAHPQAATLVLTRQLLSMPALAPIEAVLSVLRGAGASPEQSVHLLRLLVATVVGAVLREVHAGATFGVSDTEGISERRRALERSTFPAVAESAQHLARFDSHAEFEFTLDATIAAVLARVARTD
ncbi:TetR/AcrR family transcriptional regulator C-terminal domain-containing protein [Kribbella sp. NPDC050459]|uniref:TetR/AcrR family transcriptional regulator C-terminal domain-containing protein n=1 Tax=Kribbella sp. NPDC050459 TaxID=3155785 RepID=UPI0033C0FE38